jgi:hypothetical protein
LANSLVKCWQNVSSLLDVHIQDNSKASEQVKNTRVATGKALGELGEILGHVDAHGTSIWKNSFFRAGSDADRALEVLEKAWLVSEILQLRNSEQEGKIRKKEDKQKGKKEDDQKGKQPQQGDSKESKSQGHGPGHGPDANELDKKYANELEGLEKKSLEKEGLEGLEKKYANELEKKSLEELQKLKDRQKMKHIEEIVTKSLNEAQKVRGAYSNRLRTQ